MLELKKGTQLAERYTLIRRLGGGGEAATWLAKDRMTASQVALKIAAAEPGRTERLRAEWQISIRLMHAHIARAFEFHADSDVAFYSQQYIDGPEISALTGMPAADVLAPIGLIADALRYLHAKGIVHRDVKAANVLLDHNGAPYLTDFGVAATSGDTAAGGSPIAATPQTTAGEPCHPADDIFALGGLIYELISGNSPYSSADTSLDIQQRVPAPLRAADGAQLPTALVELVAAMLDKQREQRPDAQTVATSLIESGFPPGAAAVREGQRPILRDEAVEAIEAIRPRQHAGGSGKPVVADDRQGLSQKSVFLALGALILVLLGVVFVLPDRVKDNPSMADSDGDAALLQGDGLDNETGDGDATRRRRDNELPTRALAGEEITFSENNADYSGLDAEGRARFNAESALGELLSALEVLEGRGADRWAPTVHRRSRELYAEGDKAYLDKNFAGAEANYEAALDELQPLYERIEPTFQQALADATTAFDSGDRLEALSLFELAVAITPGHPEATAGFERAKNLETVLQLVDQGLAYEDDLELEAAQTSFEKAIELDPLWDEAIAGRERVLFMRTKMEFDARMTEGIEAISAGDYLGARAAFRIAERLMPESAEPRDGLLQVDQGLRLQQIGTLEQEANSLVQDEHWDAAIKTYQEILKVDSTLSFASDGLAHAKEMSALHERLDKLIAEPDRLSTPSVMQRATKLVVDITTRPSTGPRLAAQRDELSRLLKRAATPLAVPLVSDNVTQVSIYKVGRLGNFIRTEVNLRPGTYVAVGVRPGYRDVRQEFRVAPEVEMEPVIVRCEEQI